VLKTVGLEEKNFPNTGFLPGVHSVNASGVHAQLTMSTPSMIATKTSKIYRNIDEGCFHIVVLLNLKAPIALRPVQSKPFSCTKETCSTTRA
jgi:hypothetical protein